jgi:hypothetical protein
MSEKRPCVYILASKRNGPFMSASQVILYAVLGNIVRMLSVVLFAITECIGWCLPSFTRPWPMRSSAKKRLMKWRRTWKLELIERHNQQRRDLYA